MKALTLNGYDGIASLRFADVAESELKPTDILVRVRAASVNPVDAKITAGYLRGRTEFKFPHVLGRDCAGIVERTGADVTAFKAGYEIFGVAEQGRWGTQAEYAAIPAATAARKPATLSFVEAGSLPVAGLSAIAGLVTVGKLQKGQRVLIHGGAGGVGAFGVQLAKHIGATVAATASTDSVAFVKSLGADLVIDHTTTDFAVAVKDYDMVFDLIGGEVRYRSFRVLKPGGMIVHISVPPMTQAAPRSDVTVKLAPVPYDAALLDQIAALVQSGAVRPTVGSVFPFAEALKAYERVMAGHARGRTMLDLGP